MAKVTGSTPEGLKHLDEVLQKHPYVVEGPLPSPEDTRVFNEIKDVPSRKTYPHVYHWYFFLKMFTPAVQATWGKKHEGKPKDEKHHKAEKKEAPKEDFDPFADEAPAEPKPKVEEKPKPPAGKKEKKPAIAKSIVIFDVKIYDTETDLQKLAEKVYEIQMDGLVWNRQHKILDVAYGVKKLQIGCVIEDDKILTDDIFEKIEAWEEVQSTDMVTMQKV